MDWTRELKIGSRVVHSASGTTGEVYKFFPNWGVQVWVPDRGYERENWSWAMITIRLPRKIKRYPRPFRFPRLYPTHQCHCTRGRMEIVGKNAVRCNRCKNLIGSEAFPERLEKATKLLRREASKRRPKSKARKRVVRRTKGKTVRPARTRRKGKKASRLHRVELRPRRKEVKNKTSGKIPSPEIPQDNPVPTVEVQNPEVSKAQEKEEITRTVDSGV